MIKQHHDKIHKCDWSSPAPFEHLCDYITAGIYPELQIETERVTQTSNISLKKPEHHVFLWFKTTYRYR